MYKKTIFTLILFLAPVAFIEQHKKDSSSQNISNKYKYHMIKKNNLHLIDSLFKDNEQNSIKIKHYWEEDDLFSHNRCYFSNKNFLINFKRWI